MPNRKTQGTKPPARHETIVRQTRSRTAAAAADAARANLQTAEAQDDAASDDSFEPSYIDTTGGDDCDCAGCPRPNNAEKYMVKCDKCETFYHLSCANVTTKTVRENPFLCKKCLPGNTPARSSSSRTSVSNTSSRIARELARLEEEQKVQEEIEQLRLKELQRKQAYITKKYDLLNQQDENDERLSQRSYRSNRTSSDRCVDWIQQQKQASATGPTVEDQAASPEDSSLSLSTTALERLERTLNSTQLPGGKAASQVLGKDIVETGASSEVVAPPCKPSDSGAAVTENPKPAPIPLLNIEQFVLDDFQPIYTGLGVLPKTKKVPIPGGYDKWLANTNRSSNEELKAQHAKEIDLHKQRETDLLARLEALEQQQQLHRDRESQLKMELRRKEKQQADFIKQTQQAAADLKSEIERSQESERELAEQVEALRLQKQQSASKGRTPTEGQQNSDSWFQAELAKSRLWREQNANTIPAKPSNLPSIPELNESEISWDPIPTPHGGRSLYSSMSSWVPGPSEPSGFPPSNQQQPVPNGNPAPVYSRSRLTAEQIAARHVISKDLPHFFGDSGEWPLFITTFTHSTEACGYSPGENILRLQKAIKEPAKSMVSSLLTDPNSIPQLLYSLKIKFGQPEQIVNSLIKKVQDIPAPNSFDALTSFGLMVQNFCGHLTSLKMEKHLSNPDLLKQLVKKLPSHVMYNWALYQQMLPEVNLVVFGEFMSKVAVASSSVAFLEDQPSKSAKADRGKSKEKAFVNAHVTEARSSSDQDWEKSSKSRTDNAKSCPLCTVASHQLGDCAKFKNLSLDERWQTVKTKKLCRRCLKSHNRNSCKGELCCVNGCQGRHHRLLHNEPKSATTETATTAATVAIHRQPASNTLFRLLPVTLYGETGQVDTFAFLDDGSSVTLVEQEIAKQLGLSGPKADLCIHWTGGVKKTYEDSQVVAMEISGTNSHKRYPISNAYTIGELGLPPQTMHYDTLSTQFPHLKGLPVQSLESAVPRILIGVRNTHLLATLKLRQGSIDEPIATKTRIGWAVYGSSPAGGESMQHRQMHICDRQDDLDLHAYVREFFTIENLGVAVPTGQSVDEQRANRILTETTKRTESGRYETGLLWKHDYVEFPDSRPMAEKRLRCLEKRLARDPALYDNVRKQIADFQLKGYAHEATPEELASFDIRRTWYLPLGVVINPKKPGKVRVIWDAAAKAEGVSLNNMLLTGPDLLTPLLSVLFQFRERQVAIGADIEAMFHQVQIRQADRSAQLFLWRDTPEEPIKTLVTDVAIFGATCSPTHSQFVKNLNASEHADMFPRAAAAIQNNHYVDDYLHSVDTPEEAVKLALEVTEVHAKAGFNIRNWISSDRAVLSQIGAANPSMVRQFAIDKDSVFERLLGIVYLQDEDVFSFSLNFRDDLQKLICGDEVPTKRQLLSVVMSLYDPQGMVATFVVHGKIIIQDVWRTKVDWNEPIPSDIFRRWKLWTAVLQGLDSVKIPRCYFPGYHPDSLKTIQLHVFVDASEQAYAAAAYFRIVDQGERVRCTLVASKTKVAPLQPLSIPRLELLAAVLGVRLRRTVLEGHSLEIKQVYMWSDSCNTLSWIRATDLRGFRPYVGFRLVEIQKDSKPTDWRYVPTRWNVADEATKWGKGPSFEPNCRWYQGPAFLYDDEEKWPKDRKELVNDAPEELRPAFVFHHFVKQPLINLELFGRWEQLLKRIAHIRRFPENCRRRRAGEPKLTGDFNSEELQQSECSLWLLTQSEAYPDEVTVLNQNLKSSTDKQKALEKSSSLCKLSPGLDEFGVIRAQNRIEAADCVGYDAKFPIVLPRDHRVTYLLVDDYHRKFKHRNNETVVNEIRQKFVIPRLRVVVSTVARNCMLCRLRKAKPVVPRMGILPRARVTPFVRPFTFTGIDYFGPYLIKIGRSAVKRWVVLFTCLTIRAVHLEVAASLSTDSCKKAIRRFLDRRGHPLEIYSDRGTNFVGASRELQQEIKDMDQELASTFTDTITQWRFNPPATPHMGGCWERMVRSIKTALDVVPTDRKLDEESFATLLTDAENMVNSRPLTFVSLESADQESLTPNHFLLMSSSGVVQPVKTPVGEATTLRSSWNRIQHTLDGFWRRWVVEYLPTIAKRTKWFQDSKPVEVGNLVVAVDEGVRNKWTRGVVIKTFPGKDGRVRQIDMRTADGGVMRKSVAKIAVLPVEVDGDAYART